MPLHLNILGRNVFNLLLKVELFSLFLHLPHSFTSFIYFLGTNHYQMKLPRGARVNLDLVWKDDAQAARTLL